MKTPSALFGLAMLAIGLASCGGAATAPSSPSNSLVTQSVGGPQSAGSIYGKAARPSSVNTVDVADATPDSPGRIAYCRKVGGVYEVRRAEYGTNDPNPLVLSRTAGFCKFTSSSDGSRIYILTATLDAAKPSLAVLAYLAKVPIGSCQGNPASCYCSLLGGSDLFGGINAAGGGWVLKSSVDPTLEACIFPDLSSIDSWGLTYHSAGIIRGIDLSTVVRYKPS